MPLLPTHGQSPSTSTLQAGASELRMDGPNQPEASTFTLVGAKDEKNSSSEIFPEKTVGPSNAEYEEKGVIEIEDEGKKKQVRVVLEQKSGKEMIKELGGGPYTQPRW